MPEPDLAFIQRRLDALQKELREGLALMDLRDQAREASHQALVQTLTRQIVTVATALDERWLALDERLAHIEKVVVDIALKLDA